MRCFFVALLTVFLGLSGSVSVQAEGDSASRLPRFASLSKDEIFVRTGPSLQYPIRWTYKKRGLPVEIIREYDTWRQIRDIDGGMGWVHHAMLSGYRNGIVQVKEGVTLRKSSDPVSLEIVRLEYGVLVAIDKCEQVHCRVKISGFKGWLPRTALWGVYEKEEIK